MKTDWSLYLSFFLLMVILLVSVHLFFFYIRKKFPAPEKYRQPPRPLREMEKEYAKWDLLGGFLGFLIGIAGGYVVYELCRALCAFRADFLTGEYILVPHAGMCLLPVLPGAMAAGLMGGLLFMRFVIGPERTREMECLAAHKLGFDAGRFMSRATVFLAVLCLAGLYLTADTYMAISSDKLKYNTFFGLSEKVYDYADVKSIQHIADIKSRFKTDHKIKIAFRDGNVWKSVNTAEISETMAQDIAAFISGKSGIPAEEKTTVRR
jgi:hypothetical protein